MIKSNPGDDNFYLVIELGTIQDISSEIIRQKYTREEVRGKIMIKIKDGTEYIFSNEFMSYHNYEISRWMEYLLNADILKKKIDINKVFKCPNCRDLLQKDNTYCPNCSKHKCPMCDMWFEQKYSTCPDCCYELTNDVK